jgi:glycosyltransferase involved in cell wall biosynthesis
VAYVVPRYGAEVVGGAELGARLWAEHLVAAGSGPVEVFTTCALDSRTWADEYEPGTTELHGVTVHRFRSRSGRHPRFGELSDRILPAAVRASPAEGEQWIDWQGPVCPDALDAAEASTADVVVFYPYLYWPTVHGVRRLGRRAVMHPATHDEPPTALPLFQEVFAGPGGFVFQTPGERRLTERLFPAAASLPQAVVGLGVCDGEGDAEGARAALGLGDRPYLLCLGRVDDGKGTGMLARFFAAYKQRRPGPLALVLAGPVHDRPPDHPDVLLTGPVHEEVKWGVLRGATALVSPSPLESFALVLLEAWVGGVPVLVNGACAATVDHCRRSGGGLWFDGYGTFEAAVDRLSADGWLRVQLAQAGLAYVDRLYRWPLLVERYRQFLASVAARCQAGAVQPASRR